jgi:transposase, IS5 family
MRPKPISTPTAGETDTFRNRLDNMIDMRHELVRLAGLIEWKRFDEAFGTLYAEKRRPGLPTRLMVGLHLIKHAHGISDDQVCAQWIENTYFQFFCGETYFQTKLPLGRTSMSVWRGRIGADKLELLLGETLAAATRAAQHGQHSLLGLPPREAPPGGDPSFRRAANVSPPINLLD